MFARILTWLLVVAIFLTVGYIMMTRVVEAGLPEGVPKTHQGYDTEAMMVGGVNTVVFLVTQCCATGRADVLLYDLCSDQEARVSFTCTVEAIQVIPKELDGTEPLNELEYPKL